MTGEIVRALAGPRMASSLAGRRGTRRGRALQILFRGLRRWAARDRERRELAQMSERDFGDIAVPRSLMRAEAERWPWQKPSLAWAELRVRRGEE